MLTKTAGTNKHMKFFVSGMSDNEKFTLLTKKAGGYIFLLGKDSRHPCVFDKLFDGIKYPLLTTGSLFNYVGITIKNTLIIKHHCFDLLNCTGKSPKANNQTNNLNK